MINIYVNNILIKCIHIEVGIIIYVSKFIRIIYLFLLRNSLRCISPFRMFLCNIQVESILIFAEIFFSSKNNFVYKRSHSKNRVKK